MSKTIEKLIRIHDLRVMKKEFENEETASRYEEIGFKISQVDMIQEAIDDLVKKTDPEAYRIYLRVSEKYERPLVPTKDGICYGCFVTMPTAQSSTLFKDKEIATCTNCGRILYPLE